MQSKSGKEEEVVFIPQKVGNRLKEYIREKGLQPDDRSFPVGYGAAGFIVKKAANRVGVNISPHDLRRHAASFPSRSGTPIEIVSKVTSPHAAVAKDEWNAADGRLSTGSQGEEEASVLVAGLDSECEDRPIEKSSWDGPVLVREALDQGRGS